MNIKGKLRKLTELGIMLTALTTLALAGCGGGTNASTIFGIVSTYAGTSGAYGIVDATGTSARFRTPAYIASDGTNLYVTDATANNIRKIVIATGVVTTLAGSTTGASGILDATGTAARFNFPNGITTDGINLYVADTDSHTIRKIVISTGKVTTLAGTAGVSGVADATSGTSASFTYPGGVCRMGSNLYVTDSSNSTIRRIDLSSASAAVSTLAGTPYTFGYNDSTTGASAVFYLPLGITTDGTSLFVTEALNNDVRKINPATGATTTVAGGNYLSAASGVGSTDGTGTSAQFNQPWGITTDGAHLYVADTHNHTIRKILISTTGVTTLAGAAGISGVTDATGSAARFNYPTGVIYVNGVLYVADFSNGSVREIQ